MDAEQPRMGIIVPAINVTAEDEFIRLSQSYARQHSAVGVHFARAMVDVSRPMAEQFQGMADDAPKLGLSLAAAGVSVIAFACTSASVFRGVGFDREISESISAISDIPSVSTASAVLQALRTLDAGRVALATPYMEWVYQAESEFLEAGGFEVTAVNGMDRTGGRDINSISAEEIIRQTDEVMIRDTDVLFVSCTDLPSLDLVPQLEERYGKPVITSNQATFWSCAKVLGFHTVSGHGRLLEENLAQ
jgi:maleate cis-trans isomerase